MKKSLLISVVLVVVLAFGFAHAESKGGTAKSNNQAVNKSAPKASSYNTVWKPADNSRPLPKTPNTEYQKREANFKQKLNDPQYQRQINEIKQQIKQKQDSVHWTPGTFGSGPGAKYPANPTEAIKAFGGAFKDIVNPTSNRNATRQGR